MKFKRVAPVVFTGMALMGVGARGGRAHNNQKKNTTTAAA
jgi:hypothetical protein